MHTKNEINVLFKRKNVSPFNEPMYWKDIPIVCKNENILNKITKEVGMFEYLLANTLIISLKKKQSGIKRNNKI